MTFTQPLFLILLLAIPYFVYLGRPRGRYGRGRVWAALVLRCLIAGLIVLSLAGVQSVHGSDDLAVVFLVDVSDSIVEAERERALAFVEAALADIGPDDQAALVLFGADALVERPMMGGGELGEVASIPRTHQTDLEGAIRLGMALFPSGAARRMVILSDGQSTMGQAEQAVRVAHSQGVQVDVLPLSPLIGVDGGTRGEAWLSDLSAPGRLHQGEEFSLSVTAHATLDMDAVLTVLSGDVVAARERVHLNPGANTFVVPLTAGEPGFSPFRAYLSPATDIYLQNNALSAFAMVEGPPRVLVVAARGADDEDAGAFLAAALEASGLTVVRRSTGALPSDPAALAEYAAVLLVDTPAQSFAPRAMGALQSYVRDLGGGLVAVGGPHAFGVGGWYDTPLEETLPVEMAIHDQERFPPMAIVIVIDKSGSMGVQEDGVQKIRLAGEAAARVAELINDLDEITVIAFDDRPADVVGPLPGSQRDEVIERVIRLQPGGGGIYVRESLQEALTYLDDSSRSVRHIILLADGADAEHQQGVREMVEEDMVPQGITLSSVAIGYGRDLQFLEDIALLGNGRYYFTDRASTLPVIFAEETQLAMRSYVVEEIFFPRLTSVSPMLTGIQEAPQLIGYVATTPKPAGQMVLSTHQEDPLLAAWQYGLGRAVAWTSDATGRWAQQWVGWDGFTRFWAQVVRWTIVERADVPVEVSVDMQGGQARIAVDAVDESGAFVNGLEASVSLVGPGGGSLVVGLVQTAPGRYEGTFEPQDEGAYLMRLTGSLDGADALAMTSGWVMGYSPEYAALGKDGEDVEAALARLADLGGGAVLEEPKQAFSRTLQGTGATRDLWPYLLGLAVVLIPFDVGVRRLALSRRDWEKAWRWLTTRLGALLGRWLPRLRPHPRSSEEAPSPVGRLFEAKSRAEERRPSSGEIRPDPAVKSETRTTPLPAPPPPKPQEPRRPSPDVPPGETLAERLLRKRRERE
ncbi:MAG TPA: VWA domain-containing protein [Chloroflexi bacterium]|nr:VWA domain-containing protein [Chloroflexota bacterium]